jgi:hypothetical protein
VVGILPVLSTTFDAILSQRLSKLFVFSVYDTKLVACKNTAVLLNWAH